MAKKKSNWVVTRNRFVAFLDIMGFKDMVFRKSHKEMHELLISFHPTIQQIEDHARYLLSGKVKYTNPEGIEDTSLVVRSILFSDSIILVSNGDSLMSASYMFLHVGQILYEALIKGIPMKGAIAYGEQTADFEKSIHFGRPLVDAFELQNELQLYGVVLHHTMEKRLADIDILDRYENKRYFKYPTPMKYGKIIHYVVDWMSFIEEKEKPIKLVSEIYKSVSGTPRLYIDNTLEFVRWVTEKKAEIKQKK